MKMSNNILKLLPKDEEGFRSHGKTIMQLISGNTVLTNPRLDNLSKVIADLKESL